MPFYNDERLRRIRVGIDSYTNNELALDVIGNTNIFADGGLGINTTNTEGFGLYVDGDGFFTGIVTAAQFFGDGSGLDGVTGVNIVAQEATGDPVYPTFASNVGVTTLGIAQTGFVYVPSTGNVGIGSTQPTARLDVVGLTELDELNVAGVATFASAIDANGGLDVLGQTELDDLNVTGIATIQNLDVQGEFDVYDSTATFHNDLFVAGNLSIGGTTTVIQAQDLKVFDKDIILGVTTDSNGEDISTDITANHGGIAVASTEGSPLVDLALVGFSTLPSTYKQLMWVAANSYGVGTTDAWMFNYAVGIGSTLVPTNVRLAVGEVQITDDTINSPQLTVSGVSTFSGNVDINASVDISNDLVVNDALNVTGLSTFASDVDINASVDVLDDLTVNNNFRVVGLSTFQNDVNIGVGGTTAFFDVSTGYVGIGATQPGSTLVVNSPSGYTGNILDTQIGGSSRFSVQDQTFSYDPNPGAKTKFHYGSFAGNTGWVGINYRTHTGPVAYLTSLSDSTGVAGVNNTGYFAWTSGTYFTDYNSWDLRLYRDDAGILAQRNETNPNTFRVYNTYTSSTNFERANVGWTTDVFIVGTEKGVDGGSPRQLELQTDGTTRVAITTTGNVGIGSTQPTATLDVVGDVNITGIVTATKFVGEVEIINPFLLMGA